MNIDTSLTSGKHLCVIEKGQKPKRSHCLLRAVAQIGQEIAFDPQILNSLTEEGCQPVHYDLLLLCAAIEFADRHWERPQGWSRSLHLTVPVIELQIWQRPEILKSLTAVLRHLTCDTWDFEFVQAKDLSPLSWRQIPIRLGNPKTFAIAYSEGLDSRAVAALSGREEEALCIRVASKRQRRSNGDSYFTAIPFKVTSRGKESSFRSRGFQFAAMTAIAAHLSQIQRIVVPESGQGALSPVLLPLHLIHVDFRNHPTFFRRMEQFINEALTYQVKFEQPRLWSTKGQTLRAFLDLPGKNEKDLTSTHSCWQTRRIVNEGGKRKQCGLCAACLLRRLSMHAAGINENDETYVVKNLSAADEGTALSMLSQKADRDIMIEYGSVGARHLQHLADMVNLPDCALRLSVAEIAAATGKTNEETLTNLRTLLKAHAQEWHGFLSAQGEQSFLKNWMNGGRYGRFE